MPRTPALRTRPLAVAPPGADRATILALSAEARLASEGKGRLLHLGECDEKLLRASSYRKKMAEALFEGIRNYPNSVQVASAR